MGIATPTRRADELQTGVRTLLVLVACCAVLLWSWRRVREMDPTSRSLQTLRRGDPEAREVAAQDLGHAPGEKVRLVIPALLVALRDDEPRVRLEATTSLANVATEAAARGMRGLEGEVHATTVGLVQALGDRQPEVRATAAAALQTVKLAAHRLPLNTIEPDPRLVAPALLTALRDPDPMVRYTSARALGAFLPADADAPPALLELLEHGDPPFLRQAAAEALTRPWGNSAEVFLALVQILHDQKPDGATLHGPSEPIPYGGGVVPEDRLRLGPVLHGLGRPPVEAVPALVRLLEHAENDQNRHLAAQLLQKIGPRAIAAVPALLTYATAIHDFERPNSLYYTAVDALAEIAPASEDVRPVVDTLFEVLRTKRLRGFFQEQTVVQLLDRFGPNLDPEQARTIVPPLIDILADDRSVARAEAAIALGRLGLAARDALPALRRAGEHPEIRLRFEAIRARELIESGDEPEASLTPSTADAPPPR